MSAEATGIPSGQFTEWTLSHEVEAHSKFTHTEMMQQMVSTQCLNYELLLSLQNDLSSQDLARAKQTFVKTDIARLRLLSRARILLESYADFITQHLPYPYPTSEGPSFELLTEFHKGKTLSGPEEVEIYNRLIALLDILGDNAPSSTLIGWTVRLALNHFQLKREPWNIEDFTYGVPLDVDPVETFHLLADALTIHFSPALINRNPIYARLTDLSVRLGKSRRNLEKRFEEVNTLFSEFSQLMEGLTSRRRAPLLIGVPLQDPSRGILAATVPYMRSRLYDPPVRKFVVREHLDSPQHVGRHRAMRSTFDRMGVEGVHYYYSFPSLLAVHDRDGLSVSIFDRELENSKSVVYDHICAVSLSGQVFGDVPTSHCPGWHIGICRRRSKSCRVDNWLEHNRQVLEKFREIPIPEEEIRRKLRSTLGSS